MASANANAVVVDDQDIQIDYEGPNWYDVSTDNQNIKNGSLSEAQGSGTFEYLFIGSSVSVYGIVAPQKKGLTYNAVTSVYIIDDVVMGSYTAPNLTTEEDGVMFWTSGLLDVNSHNLVVNITSATKNYPYFFDYLLFTPPPLVTSDALGGSTSSSSASTSSSASSTSPLSAALSLAPATSAKSESSSSSSSQTAAPTSQADNLVSTKSHTGAIAGGVVGGVVGVLLLVLALLFWCRKRKRSHLPHDLDVVEDSPIREINATGGITGVTPYLLPRDYNSSSASVVPHETSGPLSPGASGVPAAVVNAQSKARLAASSPLASSSHLAGESSRSQQRLLSPEPSEFSSSGGGTGTESNSTHGAVVPTWNDSSSGSGSARSPKGTRSPRPAVSSDPSAIRPRQPAVHADSGLRFSGGNLPPGGGDDTLSQAVSEFPPAYTPR